LYLVVESLQSADHAGSVLCLLSASFQKAILTKNFRPVESNLSLACRSALVRLLPQVSEEQAREWNAFRRQALLFPLERFNLIYPLGDRHDPNRHYVPEMLRVFSYKIENMRLYDYQAKRNHGIRTIYAEVMAILHLLERIGDQRELEAVRCMASIQPRTAMAREIQDTALACLPRMEQWAERNRQARTLLRSSDSLSGSATDSLLCPAAAGDHCPPDQLLQPAHRPPE
jgi:hypothetical protein